MEPGQRLVQELIAESPDFHPAPWGCDTQFLAWLARCVQPGWATLETGTGSSTAALVALGARHIAISPAPVEHDLIARWCTSKGLEMDGVQFIAERSQDVLPNLKLSPLDLVLIDGWHAFPIPMIDWYFTAPAIRLGGLLVIDDIQIRPVRFLADYLTVDSRWELAATFARTLVFRKLADPVVDAGEWHTHPHSREPIVSPGERVRQASNVTRTAVARALHAFGHRRDRSR